MSFKDLGLSAPLLKAIEKQGYTEPSPIQLKAIPHILNRKDVLASAQTGTGKTAGFTLPMLQILAETKQERKRPIRALILTPTRELAAQVHENVRDYSEFLDIRSTVIFGGVNQNPQVATLRNGVDVLVATPGRLLDLYQQNFVRLTHVEFLVLDEADRMLDMGFAKDIKRILGLLPAKRQNLLFSATFSSDIKFFASNLLFDPAMVEAEPENSTAEKVIQKAYRVDKNMKPAVLTKMITDGDWQQVLVFTRTKHGANKLSEKLNKSGISSAAIHGNKTQNARTKALDSFKENTIKVLVATDIAARGLDIPLLPHVVNFELPNVPEDYVHRIGRTGRAGASGEAISLVSSDELAFLRGIEKLLEQKVPLGIIEGFEPDPNAQEEELPTQRGRFVRPKTGGGNSGGGNSGNRPPRGNKPAGGSSQRQSRPQSNSQSSDRRSNSTNTDKRRY